MDQNGDGALNHYEFKHILSSSSNDRGRILELTEEEISSLIQYLDLDNDGTIIWLEFKQLFDIMMNDELMTSLGITLQRAIRKVRKRP